MSFKGFRRMKDGLGFGNVASMTPLLLAAAVALSTPTPVHTAALTDLSSLQIYPNPYRPDNGLADDGVPYAAGDPDSGIVFNNIPTRTTVRIYTLNGQLVAEFTVRAGTRWQWDARSMGGGRVASGVYFAVLSVPDQKETVRRIAIIR
ncbi:MAG TPA: hypothetical protein DCM05_00950 [Elusimicrobia bacterium]|nr:hypothetical protein [Elusimicrobiota bacterium]